MLPERPPHPRARTLARAVLALAYFGVGVVHLTASDKFLPIMPDWVPDPRDVILATGVCEVVGSVALLVPKLRRPAGWAFAAYAVCVFPANIKHAIDNIDVPPIPSSWWYHGPRLMLQPVFVWWALWASGIVDWPFRRKAATASRRSSSARTAAPADHGG